MTTTSWSFHNPTRVHFGVGARQGLAALLLNKRVLVVTTKRGRQQMLADATVAGALPKQVDWVDSVLPNPGLADLQVEIDRLGDQHFDVVLAFGGGSALDAAKALSVSLAEGAPTRNLRNLIEKPGQWLGLAAIPLVAVATTSGTGSEVTPFATIWDHEARKKLSLAGPSAAPHVAIVDPELTYGLPFDATASTGLDALNQACESAWNRNASPVTLGMAGRAIGLALESLPRLHADMQDHGARALLAEASLLAGLCISQTRTALCHSMSYPITAHFGVSHGYACAFTMGEVAARAFAHSPERFDAIARTAGLDGHKTLLEAINSVLGIYGVAGILRQAAPTVDSIVALSDEMVTPGRADNYIVPLEAGDLEAILRLSYAA